MKRIAAILLALTAGSGLFAQGLKFDGYFESGLGITWDDQSDQAGFTAYAVEAAKNLYRFRLNGSWANAGNTAGVRFRFQSQASAGAFNIPYAYGWVKALNIITLSAGIVDDSTWSSGGAFAIEDATEGLGILARISPVNGLDLGAGVYIGSPGSGGSNNTLILNNSMTPDGAKYTFSLGYTMPDIFRATAVFRSASDNSAGSQKTSRGVLGFRLLALPALTAILEAEFDKIEDFSGKGLISLYETLAYKAGNLNFGLNAAEYLSLEKGKDDISLAFNPWVSYAFGSIAPRLDFIYAPGMIFDPSSRLERMDVIALPCARYDLDQSMLSVRPSLRFSIDSKTWVEVGDIIAYRTLPAGGTFYNVFYADFKWSF